MTKTGKYTARKIGLKDAFETPDLWHLCRNWKRLIYFSSLFRKKYFIFLKFGSMWLEVAFLTDG